MSPAPLLYLWAVAVGVYVIGISWYARNEGKPPEKEEENDTMFQRISIALLFVVPLISLGYLVLWNNLDPIRVFLVNISGLLAGGVAFFAILKIRESKEDSVGKGVSKLLAGICAVDAIAVCFFIPSLIAPCYLAQFFAQTLQKKFAAT